MLWLLVSLALAGNVSAQLRVDCFPEPNANEGACKARGCSWVPANNANDPNEPWCFFPNGMGYKLSQSQGNNYTLTKNGGTKCPWGNDFGTLQFSWTVAPHLNIRITSGSRFEPNLNFANEVRSETESLSVRTAAGDPFSFTVIRDKTSRKIFDSTAGGIIFTDKFIQIATYLPSENLYGLGENIHQTIKHDFTKYTTWGMFARDEPPNSYGEDTKNLYGVHPFYMVVEPDGNVHGVFIMNSNAQEVTTAPGPALIYRTTGGMLDIHFFAGPTPDLVLQQYHDFIGHPFLPAYWALGYQLSRYGYKNLDDMKNRIAAVRNYGIPLDTAVIDIDYMNRYKDFTVGSPKWDGLADYVKQMKSWGMKLILIFDPAIEADYDSFQRALDQGAKFIEWERSDQVMQNIQSQYPMAKNTKIMLGVVWPDKHVAFPDFLDSTNATQSWWISEFVRFHGQVEFDGIWIDMNEPSNFGTNEDHPWYYDSADHPNDLPLFCPINANNPDSTWDLPPYKTHNVWRYDGNSYLSTKTLCMSAVQDGGKLRFYNVKNLYGWSEAKYTQQALYKATNKRGAVISRSTFPSSGRFAGHWLGDNTARWEDLKTSIVGAQEFNLFGIPYVGSDICGFLQPSNEELCLRWQQMGAFHSFMRNHNDISSPPQDPAVWPSVAQATKKANEFRYRYLPYLYTLHFNAWLNGGAVIKPMFFEFPHDAETYNLSYQFMWGNGFVVAPVYKQGANSVDLYLPEADFFSVFDYNYGEPFDVGFVTVPAPTTSQIPTFVRSGQIIPRQAPGVTTTASRANPFEVLVALKNIEGDEYAAQGQLIWDDGETIQNDIDEADYWDIQYNFEATSDSSTFNYSPKRVSKTVSLPTLDVIEIFNHPAPPLYNTFKLNGVAINVDVQCTSYNTFTKVFKLCTKNFIKLGSQDQILEWKNYAPSALPVADKQFQKLNFYDSTN
ncbi:unnamed protein product [Auanema sp. JU1783]|nr:unnamed protein product [Auanema sp. JU1783]